MMGFVYSIRQEFHMIFPVESTALAPQVSLQKTKSSQDTEVSSYKGDVVSISEEATLKMKAELDNSWMVRESNVKADAENPDSKWKLTSGLKNGTITLKNGNKQTIAIDGDNLEILEYKDGRLVKSVSGSISESGASLDTEYYDIKGNVTQKMHTDVVEVEGTDGWTKSSVSRSVQWYDGDKLTGEMQDSMLLSSKNKSASDDDDVVGRVQSLLNLGTDKLDPDADALTEDLTLEEHLTSYHADVTEYGINSRVKREMTIDQEGRYDQLSNREYHRVGNMEARTTRELEHNTNLTVSVRDCDSDGKIVRDASFGDRQVDAPDDAGKGRQDQTVNVSWYNKGELVKRSQGSMSLHESKTVGLSERPGFTELFDLSDEQYLGSEPQSAFDYTSANMLESGSEPEFFMESIRKHISGGDYSDARKVVDNGTPDQRYSIDWTDELFNEEGDMVMRQRDAESARESSFYNRERAILFQTGHALTENEVPPVLRKTEHSQEMFEDGQTISSRSMEARETIDVDHDGPDTLVTSAKIVEEEKSHAETALFKRVGGLDAIDTNAHSAAKGFANETEQTLESFRTSSRSMNEEKVERQAALFVRLDHVSPWDA